MTNLLAAVIVTLVTNTSERFPMHAEPGGSPGGMLNAIYAVYISHMVPDANPTNKWVKTTVSRVTEVKFEFEGQPMVARKEEVVSEVEKEYALEKTEKWNYIKDVPKQEQVSFTIPPLHGFITPNKQTP